MAFLQNNLPLRRIIACVAILIYLGLYIGLVITLASYLPNQPIIKLIYYGITGMVWGLPILPIISWSEAYRSSKSGDKKPR